MLCCTEVTNMGRGYTRLLKYTCTHNLSTYTKNILRSVFFTHEYFLPIHMYLIPVTRVYIIHVVNTEHPFNFVNSGNNIYKIVSKSYFLYYLEMLN